MENKNLFTHVAGQPSKIFGFVPPVGGQAGTALKTISGLFTQIEAAMTEARVSPAQYEFALQHLYIAKNLVDSAIVYGWNNGQGGTA
jgi:hypothetical protein